MTVWGEILTTWGFMFSGYLFWLAFKNIMEVHDDQD